MISDLLSRMGSFTLFIAPPAWGKTRMLIDIHQQRRFRILYFSPLRALAEDFFEAVKTLKNTELVANKANYPGAVKKLMNSEFGLIIATVEMVRNIPPALRTLVVLDEFHLFYYWGESFRENLQELAMEVSNEGHSILGLTATMGAELSCKWQRDFSLGCNELFRIEVANQSLKYAPQSIERLFSRKQVHNQFRWQLQKKEGPLLLFCAYRSSVDTWVERLTHDGFVALGCKGGQVQDFVQNLKKTEEIDCIVATTALSHGVNLPSIKKIFIDYKVGNLDFWIQMVGRGGRRGEEYILYTLDEYYSSRRSIITSFVKALAIDVLIGWGLYFTPCKRR